ncbi:class I SAM-dependent methyltransferase [Brevibacillus centrosporus]|nr:class I SAM-dependent methyltransferase [Brevibacillus centrosporus]MEC2129831.1 class I SAM-dependent methyltransferase [Brevibacillus centrosporus]RNB71777.1 class I SAM-dependent methyltransferase [Brevibacillus centrosporus]GED32000.1 ubiquinone biosynthesis methyltransferase UbiE [Brevibacillus centrosporus]
MKQKIIDAYARLSLDYEKNVDTESGFNAFYERPAMLEQLPENMTGLTALDAGCAAGWYTEQLLNRGASVTAIDLNAEMIAATQRRVGENAAVLVHDLNTPLPFPDESFHHIVSSLTLHYIEDLSLPFREFQRILKPGGQLLFSVHHPFMEFTLFQRPDYFTHEWLLDVWNKKEAGRVEMAIFRRPLQEIVNRTTQFFTLERLIEPQPVPEFLEKLPDSAKSYERLMTHPHFLIIRASKP